MRHFLLVPAIVVSAAIPVQAQPGAPSDAGFVTAAANSDMYEIQAGQMAQSQGHSAAVRDFGRQMVQAHTQTSNTLKGAASSAGVAAPPPARLDARHQAMLDALQSSGEGFDRLYVSQQMAAHQEALALMQGYAANGANPALKQVASQTAPLIQQHIAMLGAMTR